MRRIEPIVSGKRKSIAHRSEEKEGTACREASGAPRAVPLSFRIRREQPFAREPSGPLQPSDPLDPHNLT